VTDLSQVQLGIGAGYCEEEGSSHASSHHLRCLSVSTASMLNRECAIDKVKDRLYIVNN
jgi:hypothetical protein